MRWFLPLLVVLGIGAGIIFFNAKRIDLPPVQTPTANRPSGETAAPPPPSGETAPAKAPVIPNRKRFILLFAKPSGNGLRPEPRDLVRPPTLRAAIRRVLDELIQGPRTGLVETLPPSTRVLEVFLDGQGTVYADFSKELSTAHPGGVWTEASTVASIVQTLTVNFEAIQKVAILVEGKNVETLAGHVDIWRPLTRLDTRSFLLAGEAPPSNPKSR